MVSVYYVTLYIALNLSKFVMWGKFHQGISLLALGLFCMPSPPDTPSENFRNWIRYVRQRENFKLPMRVGSHNWSWEPLNYSHIWGILVVIFGDHMTCSSSPQRRGACNFLCCHLSLSPLNDSPRSFLLMSVIALAHETCNQWYSGTASGNQESAHYCLSI